MAIWFKCPVCEHELKYIEGNIWACPSCDRTYTSNYVVNKHKFGDIQLVTDESWRRGMEK